MTRKCSVTPNYSLLPGIFKMKGMVPTPIQFPLHEAKLVVSMLKEYGYEVHEYVRDFYNKIIGLSVYDTKAKKKMDGSHVLFFVPVYPSSIDSSYSVNTISNIKFTNFYNTYYYLKKLYEDVVVTDPVRYRMNTLPTEVIIDGGKITALVTNSQSIIPVEPTDFDTSRIVDGRLSFEGIDTKTYDIKISKRKYYINLDTYIRLKPIGIYKYSKEFSIKNIVKKSGLGNPEKVLFDLESDTIYLVYMVDGERVLLPFSNSESNLDYIKSVEKVDVDIINWIRENGITDFEVEKISNIYEKLWSKYGIPVRPLRYVMNPETKLVIAIILENGLEVPVKEKNILDVIQLNTDLFIPDKHEEDKKDYYLKSSEKDERMRQIAKLEYEEEIFNIIKYEFSKYLQTNAGKKTKNKLISILENVFDLLHTRIARKEIFAILKKFLKGHADVNVSKMEERLENYSVPQFRQAYANMDNQECADNPHYIYKAIRGKGKKSGKKRIKLSSKNSVR